jgi:hypothetical protein
MDGLPGAAEWGVGAPLQEQELQPGVEAAHDVGIDGIGYQRRHHATPAEIVAARTE